MIFLLLFKSLFRRNSKYLRQILRTSFEVLENVQINFVQNQNHEQAFSQALEVFVLLYKVQDVD